MIRRYFLLPVFALTSFAGARDVCRLQQLKLVCDQQKARMMNGPTSGHAILRALCTSGSCNEVMCGFVTNAPSPSLNHQKLYVTFKLPTGDVFR